MYPATPAAFEDQQKYNNNKKEDDDDPPNSLGERFHIKAFNMFR
jgi:hypothetical protein